MNLLSKPLFTLSVFFKQHIRAFGRSRHGGIAIMFALLLVPMIGAVGVALDYSRLLNLRSVAQTAADGAALLAVNVAKSELANAGGSPASERTILAKAKARGQEFFDSYANNLSEGSASATMTVQRDLHRITARVAYTVQLDTTLTKVFGYNTMRGISDSGTIASLPLHYDIHLMLDISQSMGLASTEQGMKDLFVATSTPESGFQSCAFGCHVPQFGQTVSNSSVARANGIKMRVDVLRDAVQNLVARAGAAMAVDGFYRVALSTFSFKLTRLVRLTDDMDKVARQASYIDLGNTYAPGPGDTYYTKTFSQLTRSIRRNTGDGLSRENAKQFVFIITDGVKDLGGCPTCHITGTLSPRLCQAYKDRGATVGVIYTEYLPIKEDPFDENSPPYIHYWNLVHPHADHIEPALQACASEGWYFKATYESDIHAALEKLFSQVSRPPTLAY